MHLEEQYADTLCREIEHSLAVDGPDQGLSSVFYGGGTPGLISPGTLARIHSMLVQNAGLASGAEVSLETTPHAISAEKVQSWLDIGINRISIGIESLHDGELKAMGRDHSRLQALTGVEIACRGGFDNVSLDLMYALPTQTAQSWERTLDDLLELAIRFPQIKHVSAYGLHIEVNAPLLLRYPRDCSAYPQDELFEAMYEMLVTKLESSGFMQYEVSNFAAAGYQSAHNLAYWRNCEYYGFGVSAHRYLNGVRSSNWRSLARYMRDWKGLETREEIDEATRLREAIMLGLRMRAGIDLDALARQFNVDLRQKLARPLDKFIAGGFVEFDCGLLRITPRGFPVSNSIIADLI